MQGARCRVVVLTALLPDAVANLVVGLVFLGIAARFLWLPVSAEATRAAQAFAWFWALYGLNSLLACLRVASVAFGADGAARFLATFTAETALAVFSLWGMMVYLHYLQNGSYDGRRRLLVLAALAASYVAIMAYHGPEQVVVEAWRTDLTFRRPLGPLSRWWMTGSFYGLVVYLAVRFARIGRQAEHRTARRRALGVAALLVYLAVSDALVIGPAMPLPYGTVWTFLKAPAALGVLWLYLPDWRRRAA